MLSLLRPAAVTVNHNFLHMHFFTDKSNTYFKPEGLLGMCMIPMFFCRASSSGFRIRQYRLCVSKLFFFQNTEVLISCSPMIEGTVKQNMPSEFH